MEIGPENEAGHVLRHLKHVVMVVPVDAYVDKAEDIAQEDGKERPQCREVTAVRDLELQHHDGDDDCEHAVAERFKTSFWHEGPSRQERGRRLTAIRLVVRSEEHTSELQSPCNLVCRLLLEKKKTVRPLHRTDRCRGRK